MAVWVSEGAFDRAGRDLESIGLGFVEPAAANTAAWPLDNETASQVVRSVTRILGASGRYDGNYYRHPSTNPPKNVKDYLVAVAAGRCDEDTLIDHVLTTFTTSIAPGWILATNPLRTDIASDQPQFVRVVGLPQLRTSSSPPLRRRLFRKRMQHTRA